MNLPNKLTLTRILLVPVFMIFVSLGQYITPSYNPRYYLIAGLIFAVASFTDFLDGHLARKWNMVTDFGKFADPLADKLLTTVAFIYMMRDGVCSPVVLCIILAREFAVSGLRMVAAGAKDGKVIAANLVSALQHGRHRPNVLFFQLPQPGCTGMFTGAGIGNIEHIAQAKLVAGIVHQGNTLGATAHIPSHFFIPQVILGAGGGIRALGVNHHLLVEWVFIKAGGGGEKSRPLLPAAYKLGRYLFGHLPVKFSFGWHGFLSSLHVE